ncbi:MAG: hypothetical protein ACFFBY_00015 [Promethearchaeota archaeon]
MVKEKLFVCRECGFVFPKELSELIESRTQVYCESCGTPFSLEGITFKQPELKYPKKPILKSPTYLITDKSKSKLSEAIKKFNKFAYLPILIFSGIFIGFLFEIFIDPNNWINILISHLSLGIAGLLIVVYDINYISPRIESEKYDEILLDAFCFGILGCIIFGVGVLLLVKGILIIIYVILNSKEKTYKVYNFGLKLKNSLNEFSAKAGIIIAFMVLYRFALINFDAKFIINIVDFISQRISSLDQWVAFTIISITLAIYCFIPFLVLIIDTRRREKIREKILISFKMAIGTIILGIFGTIFFAIGIFILLKGILMFFLAAGKPADYSKFQEAVGMKEVKYPEDRKEEKPEKLIPKEDYIIPKEEKVESLEELRGVESKVELPDKEVEESPITKVDEKSVQIEEEVIKEKEPIEIESVTKEPETDVDKLRLHDSLLPVKDEKDKKVVKEYFSKIFTVLSKEIRRQINDLKIPKKEKKDILKELAFLTKEEQAKYIEGLVEIYKELPEKLIERIKKLPNVKPQHYNKIIEQLRYMNAEEQVNFIHFLEENA